jgi:prepilin-type N-terminal cleavage/methylation domain-containing protein
MRLYPTTRGFSLVEVLITVAVLGLLVFVVGTAVAHVLDVEMLGAGRQNVLRSADQLGMRLSEEARSSTAVYVPSVDVLGHPNTGPTGGHEVDFFRKASDGSTTYVAYRFDLPSATVTRYEYQPVPGSPQIIHNDLMAEHVTSLAAVRTTPSAIPSVVGAAHIKPVNIYYGTAELVGGNGIVTVTIQTGLSGGPSRQFEVHLSSHAAPTDIAILVPSGPPPTPPGPSPTPITVGFLLMPPGIHPPHGPNHSGDPGGGGIHGSGIPGSAEFYGNGSGNSDSWFALTNKYGILGDGTYSYQNSQGVTDSVSISCVSSPCPLFIPMPIPTSGTTLVFQTTQ